MMMGYKQNKYINFAMDTTHRIFKIRWKNNRWSTLNQIGEKKLKELIDRNDYSDFYYSGISVLNPNDENPIIISANFVVDIDHTERAIVGLLIDFVERRFGMKLVFCLHTSEFNWQLNFGKMNIDFDPDYRKRPKQVEEARKPMLEEIKKHFSIDLLWDCARIYRLPETKRLNSFVTHTHLYLNTQVSDCRGGNTLPPKEMKPEPVYMKYKTRMALSRYKNSHLLFLNYKSLKFEQVVEDIENLDKRYNIGGGLLQATDKGFQFVGLTPHNKRRVEKMMKASNASNVKNSLRFGCSLLQVDYQISEGNIVGVKPITIGKFNEEAIVVDTLRVYETEWEKRI